ncbi:MAG: hypothetical protein ABI200_07005 [Gaiellales bacterium]
MDAISGNSDARGIQQSQQHDAASPARSTTQSPPATGKGVCPNLPASGGAVGAADGGALANHGSELKSAIGRLSAAVENLRRAVEAFAQRIAASRGGGGGCGGSASGSALPGASFAAAGGGADPSAPIGSSPVQGGGPLPTSATSRTSAIPSISPGQSEELRMARGQVTYRQIAVSGGSGGTTIPMPTVPDGVSVEVYALRDFQRGAHQTQVLEPVRGPLTVPPGETVQLVTRLKANTPGDHVVNVAGANLQVHVGNVSVDAMPMMAWINESNGKNRGASAGAIGSVLAHFGVSASGNSGQAIASSSNRSPVQYFTAAYEAATRASPAETARRIVDAERKAGAVNPGATFWVQVSDEQDKTAQQANGTVEWIGELRRHLSAYGSNAKLFVAAQARPHNLGYASVVDGWATTQSAAGRDRSTAINDIRQASASYGRNVELMEYPGNAFFDAGTSGSAAISTASAALDGASGWFIYSANNHDVLERGGGDEGRGDIGGLVAIDGGRVLPTLALIEAELGANLGAAARVMGATTTSGARQVAQTSNQLDAYRHSSGTIDLRQWEAEIGRLVR